MPSADRSRQPEGVPSALFDLLHQDRSWCAYALADLEAERRDQTEWWLGERAAAILFRGLDPPWLTLHGDPPEAVGLAGRIPVGEVQYALQATHRAGLGRLVVGHEIPMWRMVFRPEDDVPVRSEAERLGPDHLPEIIELFSDHPDSPDAFDPQQLDDGFFFGIRAGGSLVSVSGTHVVGRRQRVAGVGNIFTAPASRRRGYARDTGAAVVQSLLAAGIETIVLNVAMANDPALNLYRSLGFSPFCGYYEGVGGLSPL